MSRYEDDQRFILAVERMAHRMFQWPPWKKFIPLLVLLAVLTLFMAVETFQGWAKR